MTAPPPVVLFYDKQFIVIVAKDNDAICASHAAQGIGSCRCPPGVFLVVQVAGTCRIAIASTGTGVCVEVHIAVAVQDRALHREAGCDGRNTCIGRRAANRIGCHLNAASAKAAVIAGIDADGRAVIHNGRRGGRGRSQLYMPLMHRHTACIRRIAPEVTTLGGEVQIASLICRNCGPDIAGSSSIGCGQRYCATSIFEVCNATIVEHTIVAAEVDVVANLDRACPVEAGSVVISFGSSWIAGIDLIIGAACAARPSAEVEVIAVLDNRSVDLAGNAYFNVRNSWQIAVQIRNFQDLAARAGQPLSTFIVVILADNADIENASTFVQIRRVESWKPLFAFRDVPSLP